MSDAELLSRVATFCAEHDWTYEVLDKPPAIAVVQRWVDPTYRGYVSSLDRGALLHYATVCPVAVPVDRCPAVAEYIGLVNYQLDVGSFELRWDRGEARCKTSVDRNGEEMTELVIESVMLANHQAIIHYMPNLIRVARGELTARQAFDDAENR